jgi:hypothetical protein
MRIGNTCRCDCRSSSVDELRETILAIHQLNAHWLQRITDLEPDLLGSTTLVHSTRCWTNSSPSTWALCD